MNSENVDTEPSADAQATLCPFLRGGGGGGGTVHFLLVGGGGGGRVHSAQGKTQFVDYAIPERATIMH